MRRLASAAIVLSALAADPAEALGFTARGSARQAYATGLEAGQRTTLHKSGRRVAGQQATDLGGVLYRSLRPGRYVLRAGGERKRVRVFSNRSRPRSTRTP